MSNEKNKKNLIHEDKYSNSTEKNISTTLYVIFLIALMALVYFSFTEFKQNKEFSDLIETLLEERTLLKEQIVQANKTILKQSDEISSLNINIDKLSHELNNVDKKIDSTKLLLDDFEKELQESTDWFKENSNIGNFFQYRGLSSQIIKCVRTDNDICHIKLVCLDLIHEQYQEFTYAYDDYTSNKSDKLQSLGEFYENERGDCEDFSLLVKAELNYLRDFCEERGANKFLFESATVSSGSTYYVDFSEKWFIEGVKSFFIPENYIYSYIVCGNYPSTADPNKISTSDVFGHCALGFTDKKIDSSDDIYFALKNSIIIEPQTGLLTFDQSEENIFFVPSNGQDISFLKHFVWAVITDDDYYLYNRKNLQWKGYNDFIPIIENLRFELESLNT